MLFDVVAVGEAMVLLDPVQDGPLSGVTHYRQHIGGAESNLSIGLARLGHRVAWVGRVGQDPFGTLILATLRGEGVDVSAVVTDSTAPTGVYFKERRRHGTCNVYYYRRGSAGSCLQPDDVPPALIRQSRYLHVTGVTPALGEGPRRAALAAVMAAKASGVTVVFDPNYRSKLWTAAEAEPVLRDLAARADLIVAGADEARLLAGEGGIEEQAAVLLAAGASLVVIKAGDRGAYARAAGAGGLWVPPLPAGFIVDPVGAGDAFVAGLLSGLLDRLELHGAVLRGHELAVHCMAVKGDFEGLPRRREIGGIPGPDVIR